ncbi:MAG: chemotaxis response regulator protein-glutamate methylesterase [Anaerolineae bacterium]|nr:MAG: chemotaxis response regulator protein-glutamate methylesterase [Anaerolineae bacterium]
MQKPVRVLVVDDSAYIRKVVSQMLNKHPRIQVIGTARNGREALHQVEILSPDVVTLDLLMPDMDGLGFLRQQMARRPLPVVVVSIASEEGEKALEALELGALEFVQKPTALALSTVFEIEKDLQERVLTAASVPLARLNPGKMAGSTPLPVPAQRQGRVDAVVIGVSTGGPQALRQLLPQLPADFPVPLAMVVHMPAGYTSLFAERLNRYSALEVLEARDGLPMQPGRAILAPGGLHLRLRRNSKGQVVAMLEHNTQGKPHCPSVDVLFHSAADVYNGRTLAVVLTGMGNDGQEGAAWIKAQGGLVFAEHESSCVVYGMPRAVIEAGLADRIVPLDAFAEAILSVV